MGMWLLHDPSIMSNMLPHAVHKDSLSQHDSECDTKCLSGRLGLLSLYLLAGDSFHLRDVGGRNQHPSSGPCMVHPSPSVPGNESRVFTLCSPNLRALIAIM